MANQKISLNKKKHSFMVSPNVTKVPKNNNNDEHKRKSEIDEFIDYINVSIKKINNYYPNNDPNNIEKNNNHLYFFTKTGIKCINKN